MTGDGSCAKYRTKGGNGQLDRMFEDMQTILHEASTVIEGDFEKDWDDTARSLTSSFFGLKGEGDDGKETPAADSLDGKVLAKIKSLLIITVAVGARADHLCQNGTKTRTENSRTAERIRPKSSATAPSWTTRSPRISYRTMMEPLPRSQMARQRPSATILAVSRSPVPLTPKNDMLTITENASPYTLISEVVTNLGHRRKYTGSRS